MALDLGTIALRVLVDTSAVQPGLLGARRQTGQFATEQATTGQAAGKNLGEGFTRGADGKLRDARGRLVRAGQAAGQGAAQGFERGAEGISAAVTRLAGQAGIGLLGYQALKVGVQTAAGMETARIGFTTMLGSAQKADLFLRRLGEFAARTPFEFPELQRAASSLISAGVEADRVIPIMRTLGDVTAGMGTGAEGIRRATVALQQMNAAGRITGEDLNQLRDAGIPVYDLLAAATGRSKTEVVALAQAGKLGREELEAMMSALESGKGLERFNGLMEKTSQSLSGLWSTLRDTFSQGMAEAIAPAIPLIKDGLGGAIAFTADHLDDMVIAAGAMFAVFSVRQLAGLAESLSAVALRMSATSSAAVGLSTGLGRVSSFLAGPWGIAVGLGVTALAVFSTKQAMAAKEARGFTDSLTFQKGALDDNSRQMVVKRLADEGALEAARAAGVAEEDYVRALLVGGDARDALIERLNATGAAAREAVAAGQGDIVTQEGIANSAFDAADKLSSLGKGLDASRRAADLAASANDGLKGSTGGASKATDDLRDAQKKLTDAQKALRSEAQKVIDKFTILRDGVLSTERASASFEEALDATTDSVKENGRSLDVHTRAGRSNRAAVLDMATALNDKAVAAFQAVYQKTGDLTKATAAAEKAMRGGRKSILDAAEAAGLNRTAVAKMIDKMLKTPKEVRTDVRTPGMKDAQANVDKLRDKVSAIKGKTVTANIKFTSNGRRIASELGITMSRSTQGGPTRAGGGPIPGVGGTRQDNIAGIDAHTGMQTAWVSAREYVTNAEQYRKNKDAVERINSGGVWDVIPRHAAGGPVVSRMIKVRGSTSEIPWEMDRMPGVVGQAARNIAREAASEWAAEARKRLQAGLVSPVGAIDVGNPRGLTRWKGGTFTNLFAANLRRAEKLAGEPIRVYQGGFRPATSYSRTSHKGDAVDAQPSGALIRALRRVGIASGDRTGLGNWVGHSHSVPTPGAGYAGGSAVWQAQDYLRRGGPRQSIRSPWGLWAGTDSAAAGGYDLAERGSELVVDPQFRRVRGGSVVFPADETAALFNSASGWKGSPLVGKVEQHFPQAMDPVVAADIAGRRLVAALSARGI